MGVSGGVDMRDRRGGSSSKVRFVVNLARSLRLRMGKREKREHEKHDSPDKSVVRRLSLDLHVFQQSPIHIS